MTRYLLASLLLVAATACTPRGTITLAPEAAEVGKVEQIFIGTTRAKGKDGETFSHERSPSVRYAQLDISIPPERTEGTVNWPRAKVPYNTRTDMLTVRSIAYATPAAFRGALGQAIRTESPGTREAVVFVHGFNNTFAESLYRFAQMVHDMDLPGAAVHYSWPSQASVLGYVYDRDSVLFARDGLEDLLQQVAQSGAQRILLVAHSMGTLLTMETLRQMSLRKDNRVLDRLTGVVLMSPDIDVDVFRAQSAAIGKLPQPFVIFSSRNDTALLASSTIAGEEQRLGNIKDVSLLAGLDVQLIDTSKVSTTDSHFAVATSPALLKLMSQAGALEEAFTADAQKRVGLIQGAVLSVQGATSVILEPLTE